MLPPHRLPVRLRTRSRQRPERHLGALFGPCRRRVCPSACPVQRPLRTLGLAWSSACSRRWCSFSPSTRSCSCRWGARLPWSTCGPSPAPGLRTKPLRSCGGGAKRLVQELREQAQRSTEATDEEIAGSEAAEAPPPVPSQSERAKPSKSRPAEAASTPPAKPHKGPQHLPPAAASNTPDPSQFDLSSVQHPPELKELRSVSAGHSGR